MLGLLLGSLPAVSRRLGDRSSLGLAAVLAAPTLMMLVMVPRFYEPLERHPFEHALYHLAMAALRPPHRTRRDPARPRHRPAHGLPLGRDGADVRRRDEMSKEPQMSDDRGSNAHELGRALALAGRRPRRRRHHPRPADRRLRDRLPPRPRPPTQPAAAAAARQPPTTATTTTTATTATTPSPAPGPVTITPALVARGKVLYTRRRLLRLPLAHRHRRRRPQLQRPRRQHASR